MFPARSPVLTASARLTGWLGLLLALGLAAQAAAGETEAHPLLAGCEVDYPPYCSVTPEGRADGFAVELLQAALRVMGRTATFKTGPWDGLKQDLAEGRLQVLPLVGRTPEREALFDFTFPYLTMHGTVVVRKGETGIRSFDDLPGKRVAVLKGDNAEEFVRRSGLAASIAAADTYEIALRELAAGRHDAVVIQRLVFNRLQRQYSLEDLVSVGPPLAGFVQKFCFAVRKGDDRLLSLLNEGLALVMADGTFRQLHERWLALDESAALQSTRLVVGGNAAYPPYSFRDAHGQPTGFLVELTQAIARETGLAVDIQLGPWPVIKQRLLDDEIAVAQGMNYSAARAQAFCFSPASVVVSQVLVHRSGSPPPVGLADLAGRRLLVHRDTVAHEQGLRLGHGDHLILTSGHEEALRRLAAGEGDCALVPRLPALYWIEQHGWRNLIVSQTSITTEGCYAALRGREALMARFTEGLAVLEQKGRIQELRQKWFAPYEESPSLAAVARTVALVALPLLALLVGFILWTRILRHRVAQATARYRELFDAMVDGFALHEIILDPQGVPCDYRFLQVNPAFERLTGLRAADIIGRRVKEVLPMIEASWIATYGRVALTGEPVHFEDYAAAQDKHFEVNAYRSAPGQFACVFKDCSERKRAALALQESQQRLALATDSAKLGIWDWDIVHDRMV